MSFDLKVGFACNNDCIHCVITSKAGAGNLTTSKIKEVIDKHIKEGEDVTITGGEPTIRSDFFTICEYIKEKIKGRIILQTNGRAFKDVEFTKKAMNYIDIFLIAFHSHNNIKHDMITRKKGSWEETVKGLKNIISFSKNIRSVYSQTVISKLNIKNLVKTYDFLFQLGIRNMNLTFPHPNGNALTNFDIVVPKYSEINSEIKKCLREYSSCLHIEAIPRCYTHPYNIHYYDEERMNSFGNSGYDEGIKNKHVSDYNSLILKDYRKSDVCKLCIYNDKCPGVWKEYFDAYEKELDLIPVKEGVCLQNQKK